MINHLRSAQALRSDKQSNISSNIRLFKFSIKNFKELRPLPGLRDTMGV